MSYDFYLLDPVTKEVITTPNKHEISGGTYQVGGDNRLWLNITYNYAPLFMRAFHNDLGVKRIVGKTGAESIPILQDAISNLEDNTDPDYWEATDGNAKKALCGLLAFAQLRPDGVWGCDY